MGGKDSLMGRNASAGEKKKNRPGFSGRAGQPPDANQNEVQLQGNIGKPPAAVDAAANLNGRRSLRSRLFINVSIKGGGEGRISD